MTSDGGDDEVNETWLESSGLRERTAEAAPAAFRVTRPDTAAFLMAGSSSRKSANISRDNKDVVRREDLNQQCIPVSMVMAFFLATWSLSYNHAVHSA
jgi:hypothetical protein